MFLAHDFERINKQKGGYVNCLCLGLRLGLVLYMYVMAVTTELYIVTDAEDNELVFLNC